MSWKNPPTRFSKTVNRDIDKEQRRVSLIILRELIIESPRDTGRFVNNWIVGLGNASSNTFKGVDPTGLKAMTKGTGKINKSKSGKSIFITNNLPYAVRLNQGHSQQAPANFVERAIERSLR